MPKQNSLPVFHKEWAGSIEFQESLSRQESLKESLVKKNCEKDCDNQQTFFLVFEPSSPVVSLGLRSDNTHILKSDLELKTAGLSVVKVRRGGEATLHSPGQLVIYPVVQLKSLGLRVKDFIIALQYITQFFLKELGIETKKGEDFAGLYTKKGKIAFFGIHISKGLSQSGLSLNVTNDLSFFKYIKSCGESKRSHDKISNYKKAPLDKKNFFFHWSRIAEKKLIELKKN